MYSFVCVRLANRYRPPALYSNQKLEEKMPKRNSGGEIVSYNPWRRVWIYNITNLEGKIIYVGQTVDLTKRISAHVSASSACSKLRAFLESMRGTLYSLKDHFHIFETLKHGVPASRADEFECFLIKELGSHVYEGGCNISPGNNYTEHEPKFDALREEVKNGYVWPSEERGVASVLKAMAEVNVLTDLNEMVGDIHPSLSDDLRIACQALEDAEKWTQKAAWEIARELAEKYDGVALWERIDRNELDRDINQIKAALLDEEVPDEDMLGLVRSISLFNNPHRSGVAIDSFTAKSLLNSLFGAIAARDDAKTKPTTNSKNAERCREWSFHHEGKKPTHSPPVKEMEKRTKEDVLEETANGIWFDKWKTKSNMPEKKTMDLKFRFTDWYEEATTHRTEKCDKVVSSLNGMLLSGMGLASEPDFEGKKLPMKTSKNGKKLQEYVMLTNIIGGHFPKETLEKVFENVDEERAEWYIGKWEENRDVYLEKTKQSAASNREKRRQLMMS